MKKFILLLFCTLLLAGCVNSNQANNSDSMDDFKVYLIPGIAHQTPLDYVDPWWAELIQNAELEEVLFTQEDVEVYDWENQEIVLTPQASERLLARNKEDFLLDDQFLVTLGGERLYAGTIQTPITATVPDHPIMYWGQPDFIRNFAQNEWKNSEENIILIIRPFHQLHHSESYQENKNEKKARIEIEEIREFFEKEGRLVE